MSVKDFLAKVRGEAPSDGAQSNDGADASTAPSETAPSLHSMKEEKIVMEKAGQKRKGKGPGKGAEKETPLVSKMKRSFGEKVRVSKANAKAKAKAKVAAKVAAAAKTSAKANAESAETPEPKVQSRKVKGKITKTGRE